MKFVFLFAFTLLQLQNLNAQIQLDWVRASTGANYEYAEDIAIDTQGNTYTIGGFQGTVDFEPGSGITNLTSTGFYDGYIQKLNSSGQLVWVKQFASPGTVIMEEVCLDSSGNVLILGRSIASIDADPDSTIDSLYNTNPGLDSYIIKLNANGDYAWGKSISGPQDQHAYGICVDANDNVYTSGNIFDTTDFDPGPGVLNIVPTGFADGFVTKWDSNGNMIWVKIFEPFSSGFSVCRDVAVDPIGNVIVVGQANSPVDLDPNGGTHIFYPSVMNSGFAVKLDNSGNFLWSLEMTGDDSTISHVGVDASANIYLSGISSGTNTVNVISGTNSSTTSFTANFTFALKLTDDGDHIWTHVNFLSNTFVSAVGDMFVSSDGSTYLTGGFNGINVEFNNGISTFYATSDPNYSAFFKKLDSSGVSEWVLPILSTNTNHANGITAHPTLGTFVCGGFSGTNNFGIQNQNYPVVATGDDSYTARYIGCSPINTFDTVTACNSFTWIDEITYTSSNTTATHTISSPSSCDTIVHLDLTIVQLNSTVSTSGDTLVAGQSNSSYQWIDCETNQPILGATNQFYLPESGGNYAVVTSYESCSDTSECTSSFVGVDALYDSEILLYPNPTRDLITIKLPKKYADLDFKIISAQGRLLFHRHFYNSSDIIETLSIPPGYYFAQVSAEGNKSTIPFIVE